MKRRKTHGGRRAGAGRPITSPSRTVAYRVPAVEHAELAADASVRGMTIGELAREDAARGREVRKRTAPA
jgi:hypothetical protein